MEVHMKILPNPRKENIQGLAVPNRGKGAWVGWEGRPPVFKVRASEPVAPHGVCLFLAECLLQPVPRKGDRARGALGQWEEFLCQHPRELLPAGGGLRAAGRKAHQRL